MFDDMSQRLRVLMTQEGLEYGERTHTYNSRLAQELAVSGDEHGVTDALHDALFRAYFVEGRNLASTDVLLEIAHSAGLQRSVARAAIEDRVNRSVIDAHWSRARAIGVTGVPTFVANGMGVVGAQPYETLERLMSQAGIARRGAP
jgi:predicted DsbA family dithiol-disulfide isomerase